jgi:hypothetical protein
MIYNLKLAKNHIELYAVTHSSSFGTQYVEYTHEALDGTKTYAYTSNDEGNWITPSIKNFNSLMKFTHCDYNFKHNY